jgi:DHA2 family multidrug resistance protein
MLSRDTQKQYNILGAHVSGFDIHVRSLLEQIRSGFMARGMDFTTATQAAYSSLAGMVNQQAVMVAFVQLFRILALVFAIAVPLVFIMRRPRSGQPAVSAH